MISSVALRSSRLKIEKGATFFLCMYVAQQRAFDDSVFIESNIWSAWLLSLPQGNPRGGFYTAPTRTSRMIMICLDRPQIMTTMTTTTRIAGMKRNRNKKKRWWSKILFQATKRENIKRFFFSFLVLV